MNIIYVIKFNQEKLRCLRLEVWSWNIKSNLQHLTSNIKLKEELKLKNGIKTLAMWLIIGVIFVVLVSAVLDNSESKMTYSELISAM